MGLEVSKEAVPPVNPVTDLDNAWFGALRYHGRWPTLYAGHKEAADVDVLGILLLTSFLIFAACFYIALLGVRGKEQIWCFIRVTISLFLGASIILCNYGQEWESAEVLTQAQYKAGSGSSVTAKIGVHIGLRNVNVTLKGEPINQLNETINYNERFWWAYPWKLGSTGFGPESSRMNQEYRAAQRKGLPYPILWVVEYFTLDGEGLRWMRNYKTAGWYTHIMLWTAFPLWLVSNMLFFMNPRFGSYGLLLMGVVMLVGNVVWAAIRNHEELAIPFDGRVDLKPQLGWCFWLNLFSGFLSIILGAIVFALDIFLPDQLATFFGVDVLKDYEEFYPDTAPQKAPTKAAENGKKVTNGQPKDLDDEPLQVGKGEEPVPTPLFRKRGFSHMSVVRKPSQPDKENAAMAERRMKPVLHEPDVIELIEETPKIKLTITKRPSYETFGE